MEHVKITSSQWVLVANRSMREARTYDCCKDQVYPSLTVELIIRRESTFACCTIRLPQFIAFVFIAISFFVPAKGHRVMLLALAAILAQYTIYFVKQEVGTTPSTPYVGQ